MLDSYGDRECPTLQETISILSCAFQDEYPHKDDVFIRNIVTHHVSNADLTGSYSTWTQYILPDLKKAIKTDLDHTEDPMATD
ncbi:MAG: hypothetical protein CMB96_00090 [Flavobacteriaceae bacterium]|nr:hypothetical protein [Flavobacteriaceae bacterium]|tara:strand:- start:7854 stop:8102 length:249 start_codon:yes stop_codon:yes gene_type:complete